MNGWLDVRNVSIVYGCRQIDGLILTIDIPFNSDIDIICPSVVYPSIHSLQTIV